jgi:hypothetical protein
MIVTTALLDRIQIGRDFSLSQEAKKGKKGKDPPLIKNTGAAGRPQGRIE